MRKLKRQTGFGLLELMLSMVIVALLLIMATRYYQSARSNARINEGVGLISSILNAANNIAIGSGSYSGATTSAIVPYLPSNEQGSDKTSIVNPWGGEVTVTPSGTNNTLLTIVLPGLGDDCQKLKDAMGAGGNTGSYSTYDCTAGTFTVKETLAPNAS